MPELKYKRVLIKISGEALAGEKKFGLDIDIIRSVCSVLKKCQEAGAEIGVVVGAYAEIAVAEAAGTSGGGKIERTRADHMGMMATAINALALADALEKMDVNVRVQTAVEMRAFAEPYVRLRACRHLEKGRVVIFGCGTGNPYFSTDTAAVLRGAEIDADVILLAKNIDGIYDDDPNKNPNARKFDKLSYDEMLARHLMVMDTTATSLSMDNDIPVLLFALKDPENIYRAIMGENVGTLVVRDEK